MTASINLRRHCLAGGQHTIASSVEGDVSGDHLRSQALALAGALAVRPEHSWGIWYGNAWDFLCGFMALALAGKRIVMPHNMQAGTAVQLARQFDALLTDQPLAELPSTQWTPQMLRAEPRGQLPETDQPVELILFTSGSTGEPQPIAKTLMLLETELALLQSCFGDRLDQIPVVTTVTHQHIYGLLHGVLWPWWRGAPFVVGSCQYPEELVQRLNELGQAVLVSSPTHLSRLPQSPVFRVRPPGLTEIFSSGGPMAESDALALAQLTGQAPLEILGSTETGGVAWRRQSEGRHWQLLPGVEASLSARGCLQVVSKHLGLPAPFEMGDQAELLSGGQFVLRGRADQVVKVEGKRLSLTDMQQRLEEHWAIAAVRLAVLRGRRDEVGAVVVLSPEGHGQLQETGKLDLNQCLRRYLKAFFEAPLLPRRWRYVQELPLNSQGKVTAASIEALLGRGES